MKKFHVLHELSDCFVHRYEDQLLYQEQVNRENLRKKEEALKKELWNLSMHVRKKLKQKEILAKARGICITCRT
ncbi:hypothetical protein Avbf_09620 [Armadillidium vulgare]|nr:hypothetical protein Avbf_09620 [Armadillidium vulgare]